MKYEQPEYSYRANQRRQNKCTAKARARFTIAPDVFPVGSREITNNSFRQNQKAIRFDRCKLLAPDYPFESTPVDRAAGNFDDGRYCPEHTWAGGITLPSLVGFKSQTGPAHASSKDIPRGCNRPGARVHSTHSSSWHFGQSPLQV